MTTENLKNSLQERLRQIIFIFVIFSMTLFLIGFGGGASESIGTFKVNSTVRIVQVCSDATSINISSIAYPNSSISDLNISMIPAGNGEFYYNYNLSSVLGRYEVRGIGNGCEKTFATYFEITYTGEKLTNEQTYIYIMALTVLILFLLGLVFIISKLPSGDSTNEEGTIIQVNMLKHLRPVLWSFIWIIGTVGIFIISNLGVAYLNNAMIGDLFFTIYRLMFYVTVIGIPVYFIFIFVKIFKDKQMKQMMERGIEFKGKVI